MEENMVILSPVMTHRQNLSPLRSKLGIPSEVPLENDFTMPSLEIVIWNCRGAGNERFKSNFKHIMGTYKPEVVALWETKVPFNTMGLLFKQEGLSSSA